MIQKIAIVGMGALGLLYADQLTEGLKNREAVSFVMDASRLERHKKDVYEINGVEKHFCIRSPEDVGIADLVIVAVKFPALAAALDTMAPCVGPNTKILSVMNGVISEEILAERFGEEKLLYAIAQGMDAMRDGSRLKFTKCGEMHIGQFRNYAENVQAVQELLVFANVPHVVEADIVRALWFKFMINVGVNQTCLCFDTNYREATAYGSLPYLCMVTAMKEVVAVGQAKGIALTEADVFDVIIPMLKVLDPDGYPSMAQDGKARRRSEVEMFAGAMIRFGRELGIPTPGNQFFYNRIREIEANY